MSTSAPAAAAPLPRGGLLRNADFRRLWAAETISQFGTQVTGLAIPLVALYVLQASTFEVALLTAVDFLPFILVSLPAGVWVDRLRRRPILIVGDVGRAALLASIPIAHVLGVLSIWQLYIVGFSVGVLTVFFDVAYQSYLPALVDREHLVEGNAKLDISRSAAQLAGPGIGGYLVGLLTAPVAIVVDAISFVASALFVVRIRRQEPAPDRASTPEQHRTSMRTEVAAGLRWVLGHPYLRYIAASTATSNLFSNITFSIFIVFVVRELGMTPEAIGLVFGLSNVGFLLGAVFAGRIARRLGVGWTIILSMFVTAPAALLVALAPRAAPIPFILVGFAVVGFGGVVYNVNQVSLRQAITPDRMQGRMNATMRFIVWGTIPIGATLGGILGTTIGLRETLIVGAAGSFLAVIPLLLSPLRGVREMPTLASADAPDGGDDGSDGTPATGAVADEALTGPLAEGDEGVIAPGHRPLPGQDEARDPDA
jgi:MFS family permease